MRKPRRALRVVLGLLGLVALGLVGLYFVLRHPLPEGRPGPEADALARALVASVDGDAWARTGAVRWTSPRGTQHLWDRARNYHQTVHDGQEVLVDLGRHAGRVFRGGREVTGDEARRAVEAAWALWANDSFWLNPVPKVFDDGVRRSVVTMDDGTRALLAQYASGGVTPGDSYLWIPGRDGRPRAWRMWVKILPVPGLEVSWEGWTRLSTGAWVSTRHSLGGILPLRLTNIRAAPTLGELVPGEDPFARLANR